MLLHLLPLSCPAPPFRLRGGSPRVRAGGRARTRALRGADVEPETPPRRRRGRDDDHDPHAAGSGGDTGALLASVRRLLLSEAPTAAAAAEEEEEEQGQFPKRWAIVFLCFSAFLLCNMDRVGVTAGVLLPTPALCTSY
jgi:ACS family sodium-dependent inorganic phosphate cotransporter